MRKAKRSWRFIVVSVDADLYNPYAGIARCVTSTSARTALNALCLSDGAFYGLVYEPRTRLVISSAVRVDEGPAVNIPLLSGTTLPINTTLDELEAYVRGMWRAV